MLAAEVGPLDFDDLGMPHDAQPGVDLFQRLGRGRLSGAGWTDEEHVVGLVGQRQPGRHPQGPDLDLVLDLGHRPFDFTQPDLIVEQSATLRQQLFRRSSVFSSRRCCWIRRAVASHLLLRVSMVASSVTTNCRWGSASASLAGSVSAPLIVAFDSQIWALSSSSSWR